MKEPIRISFGNRAIGIGCFISIILLTLILLSQDRLEARIPAVLILVIYTVQAYFSNYITLIGDQFIIENIFRRKQIKGISMFVEVTEPILFSQSLKIFFSDGTSFHFAAESDDISNKLIREHIAKRFGSYEF